MFCVSSEDKHYSLCKALESTIIYIILVLAHDLGYQMYKRVAVHYMVHTTSKHGDGSKVENHNHPIMLRMSAVAIVKCLISKVAPTL